MRTRGTLLLSRHEIAELLTIEECIGAVETAFRVYAEGRAPEPRVSHVDASDGIFHIKAGGLGASGRYVAVKVNGNFPHNATRFGLPTIQGVIVLCDGENGFPLAVMDSIEITIQRTAATTALAARLLARPDSKVATICGCGKQGRMHLIALKHVIPHLSKAYAFDLDAGQALQFAIDLSSDLRMDVTPVNDLARAVGQSDICITCTTSRQFFLRREFVAPGTFVGAVGADSPEKQELDPALLAVSKVVVDILGQSATMGELHHALRQGSMTTGDVHAELGEVIAGRKPGRTSPDEIIVFDSTGTALQDVAAASIVYEKAIRNKKGVTLQFFE